MNNKALNKVFSNAVAAKLAEGFTICTQTMGGTQGERAKVNFTDEAGNHYSLYMDKTHVYRGDIEREERRNNRRYSYDKMIIYFVRSNELHGDLYGRFDTTLWLGEKHCTTLEKREFWVVGDGWFVESDEEAEVAAQKHFNRLMNKSVFEKQENPVAVTKKSAAVVCSLYKKNKKRNEKAIKPGEITGITLEHDSKYGLHVTINGTFENGRKGFWANFKKGV